ncbi:MAG: response regulator [Lachnospiraceae bacterium]|nr:response regulator [Lachnospiraceae bacterium]
MINDEKKRILNHISHEMRTPMNAVLSFTELAMQSDSLSEIRGHLKEVHKASRTLMAIVNENLEGSKEEREWIQNGMEQSVQAYENTDRDSSILNIDLEAEILIVDDNDVNLRIACALLGQYGFHPDTASSGFEALKKTAEKQYQMVFMDYMMPGTDGKESMDNIRYSHRNYRNIPFVALTANAVAGTKESMLAEGFDDYLSKPIYKGSLESILEKWLSSPIPGVELRTGIENCGGEEVYQSILEFIVEHGQERAEDLQRFLETDDMENYTIAVHSLKSTLANIGAMKLSEMAKKLEMAGKKGHFEEIRTGHGQLIQDYQEVLEHIKNYLEHPQGGDSCNTGLEEVLSAEEEDEPMSREEAAALLKDVAALLQDFQYGEAEIIMKEMLEFEMDGDTRRVVQNIYKNISNLRMEEAVAEIMAFSC